MLRILSLLGALPHVNRSLVGCKLSKSFDASKLFLYSKRKKIIRLIRALSSKCRLAGA